MLKYVFESNPEKKKWCSLLYGLLRYWLISKVILTKLMYGLLCTLGCNDSWLFQGIGDSVLFLSLVKQRLKYQFIQN